MSDTAIFFVLVLPILLVVWIVMVSAYYSVIAGRRQMAALQEQVRCLAPLSRVPRDEAEYDALVSVMDKLLEIERGQEDGQFAGLIKLLSEQIAAYDTQHFPIA